MDVLLDNANGKLQMAEDRATAAEEHVERVREQLARFKASAAQREKDVHDSAEAEREEAERHWQEKVDVAEKVTTTRVQCNCSIRGGSWDVVASLQCWKIGTSAWVFGAPQHSSLE